MNTSFRFDRTFAGVQQNKYNFDYWKTVTDLYDNGQYKESVVALLRYIDESLVGKYGNADQTEFNIPHGSTIVNIKIGQTLELTTPFVNLPTATSVPLMRQVAQLNFWPLTISTAVLTNNQITFRFSCPIELAEPNKIFYTIKEMCLEADHNDDRFIEMFNASYIQEPKIERYTAEQLENAWAMVQTYIAQGLSYLQQFESKRWGYYWDILVCTLMQIDYFAAPQGFLHAEIDKAVSDILDNRVDYNKRIQYAKVFLEKLKTYDKQKFLDCIYKTETFIPFRTGSSIDNIRHSLSQANTTSIEEIKTKNYIAAYFTMYYSLLRLFYYNAMNNQITIFCENAMQNAANKLWEEAALSLRKDFDLIMDPVRFDAHLLSTFNK